MGRLCFTPLSFACYNKGMPNRILHVEAHEHSLDFARAEIWITAAYDDATPRAELRGQLAGPRCLYASTVEVGYPLRPISRRPDHLEGPAAQVVIPEPSLWEPQCPFVYQGTVELWQDGQRCDQVRVRQGLRRLVLGRGVLRVNGRPLALRGRRVEKCNERQLAALRQAGCNLLLASSAKCLNELLSLADVQGFFVLALLKEDGQVDLASAESPAAHPSFLGWLLTAPQDAEAVARLRGRGSVLVGVEVGEIPPSVIPTGVDFVARRAGAADGEEALPVLLFGGRTDPGAVFGRVE